MMAIAPPILGGPAVPDRYVGPRPPFKNSHPKVVISFTGRKQFVGRRHSRNALLFGAFAIVAAHVWLMVMVETDRPEWRDPEFFHRRKQLVALGESQPLLVILGGSRPQMGLNPETLNRVLGDAPASLMAYSCSQSGALPIGIRLNLSRLLDAGIAPKYALIEVLPPVLADPGPMEERIPIARLDLADLRHLQAYQANRETIRLEWAKVRLESWYTLRLPLLANWGLAECFPSSADSPHHLWTGMTAFGWKPFTRGWTAAQRAVQLDIARRTYSWLLDEFRIQSINDCLYRDMLRECRERGIRAALFVMPESPRFRSWYPPGVRDQINDYLGKLSREFAVPIFDASAWIDDEEAFMDGHHLLGVAAEPFSARFGRECVAPWVRGK